jgi:solute carrier family 10 (sodium/bile acid cotransporter), member 7
MAGIVISPLLILAFIGVSGDVDIGKTFYELSLCVILPMIVGQVLRQTSKTLVEFAKKYKGYFSQAQQYCLVFIIYTTFCRTFSEERESNIGEIFLMILFQLFLLLTSMVVAWVLLRLLFRDEPELRVMGLFGCTHKTITIGIPLINAIYDGDPNAGVYTLPLLIWYPMQLMIGSALCPRLKVFVEAEKERLCVVDKEDSKPDDVKEASKADDVQEDSKADDVQEDSKADDVQPLLSASAEGELAVEEES